MKQIRATGTRAAKKEKKRAETYWDKKTGVLKSNNPAKTNPVTEIQIEQMRKGRVRPLKGNGEGKKGLNISLHPLGTPRDKTTRRRGTGVPLGHVA